ncbi:uncharacterized protein CMC5_010640 [Chondromyces crocatus]|uniref:DUF898 domain-containing protein n=3 Tax=Pseudomonadati TaxID=3379134 RepID=A0A0K1E8N5_CHOCO|nr:uncharacterized protein CMC5_010640 [Chondromyces crocatus]
MAFEGQGGEFFGKVIGGYLLTLITFGIYAPWFICSLTNYIYEKSNIQTSRGPLRVSFRGEGGSLFGVLIVSYLLTAITFGIYAPWAICKVARYFNDNTFAQTADGRTYQLRFTGEGGDLFGTWIVNVLLMGVTFYIYTPWALCKIRKWFYERMQIVENGQPVGKLDFVGEGGTLFGTFIGGVLLTMITFGIYGSWFKVTMQKFWNQNTRISLYNRTYALDFVGQGADLFVINLVTSLLVFVTLGIYYFWGQVKKWKWEYQNTLVRALN